MKVNESVPIETVTPKKSKKTVNFWGIYISLCFIIIGLVWYGVNIGVIPLTFIQQQAGPIIVVLIGLLILFKSVVK